MPVLWAGIYRNLLLWHRCGGNRGADCIQTAGAAGSCNGHHPGMCHILLPENEACWGPYPGSRLGRTCLVFCSSCAAELFWHCGDLWTAFKAFQGAAHANAGSRSAVATQQMTSSVTCMNVTAICMLTASNAGSRYTCSMLHLDACRGYLGQHLGSCSM